MTSHSAEKDGLTCRHCGLPTFREGGGRWAHEYDVRGHVGPWLYCPSPHVTRPEPATPAGKGNSDG